MVCGRPRAFCDKGNRDRIIDREWTALMRPEVLTLLRTGSIHFAGPLGSSRKKHFVIRIGHRKEVYHFLEE
jgi:hypothetical protein